MEGQQTDCTVPTMSLVTYGVPTMSLVTYGVPVALSGDVHSISNLFLLHWLSCVYSAMASDLRGGTHSATFCLCSHITHPPISGMNELPIHTSITQISSIHISIYISIYLPVNSSTHPSIHPSTHPSSHILVHLPVPHPLTLINI